MSEWYPEDSVLEALAADPQTGVEYIETGKAPYYLEFRRMLHRILANLAPLGLRVFKTGDLACQVKPGYYWLGGELKLYAGSVGDESLANNDTNYVYIDDANAAQVVTDGTGWPAAEHVKLAEITTAGGAYDPGDITDLRGYSMLTSLNNLTLSAATLDTVGGLLDGAVETDYSLHGHDTIYEYDDAAAHSLKCTTTSGVKSWDHTDAGESVLYEATQGDWGYNVVKHDTNGIHDSIDGGAAVFTTRRVAPALLAYALEGEIAAGDTGNLMGMIDVDGTIEDVVLSVQENGSDSADPLDITAQVKVNGTAVCSVDPAIDKTAAADTFATTAAAGAGITQATVKSDGTEDVSAGDIISVDLNLTRTTPDTEITGPVVLLKVRPTAAS